MLSKKMLTMVVVLVGALGACERRGEQTGEQPEQAGREGAPGAPGAPAAGGEREQVAGRESHQLLVGAGGQTKPITDNEMIRNIEQKLANQGVNPGPVDGRADAQLMTAIRQFQQMRGLPPTGMIDRQTATALELDWQQLSEGLDAAGEDQQRQPGMRGQPGQPGQPGMQREPGQQPQPGMQGQPGQPPTGAGEDDEGTESR